MKTFEAAALMREVRFLMEIAIVQDATDFSNGLSWINYLEWEASRRWLIDVNRNEPYCSN
jgi:hypothetical protein